MTKKQMLINMFKNNPGRKFTIKEIMQTCSLPSMEALYSLITMARKEEKLKIINLDGTYALIDTSEVTVQETNTSIIRANFQGNNVTSLSQRIKALPPSDANDVLDMLKKSVFYKKSALALIEANEQIKLCNFQNFERG